MSIVGFIVVYLYFVNKERAATISLYFPKPAIGDIYKMQMETRDDGVVVYYLKIKDIGKESIYFYGSKLMMGAMHDSFLKQFDTSDVQVIPIKDLQEIAQGKWKEDAGKDHKQILEIERK